MAPKLPDPFSPEERSRMMARVRSAGNKSTELRLRALFRAARITGWRRKQKLFGKPDFVFSKARLALFVDGCFWHGCPRCYRRPGTRQQYWDAKVRRNRARDKEVTRALKSKGWKVLRVWEHELKQPFRALRRIVSKLR